MAIKLTDNFALNSRQALDARNQFNTFADLKAVTDAVMDDGHLAYCLDNQKYYVYNKSNNSNTNVGKWRELQTTVPGKGQPNGVASLGSDGKVPASQLPSYVDDVLDYTMEVSGQADGASAMPSQTVVDVVYDKTKKVFLAAYSGGTGVSYAKKWNDVNGDTKLGWQAYGVEKDGFVVPTTGKIYVYTGNDANQEKPESKRWLEGVGLVAIGGGSVVIGDATGTAFDGGKGKALEDKLNTQSTLVFSSFGQWEATADKVTNKTMTYRSLVKGVLSGQMQGAERPIPVATKTTAGVMTAADKTKLDLALSRKSETDNYVTSVSINCQGDNEIATIASSGILIGSNKEGATGSCTLAPDGTITASKGFKVGNGNQKKIVMADGTLADMPSGGTADAPITPGDINGAIADAFK